MVTGIDMQNIMRLLAIPLLLGVAVPASAQRGGRPPNAARAQANPDTSKKSATKTDTTKKSPAVSLDFQDQDLKVVLDALSAAGDLNVAMTNIPQTRVTIHLGKPVTREGMIELVKSVAEANNLKVTQTPTLMQISGPVPEPVTRQTPQQLAQQLLGQQQQQAQMRLFSYRLKHANAVQLAPVLTNLFSGFSSTAAGRAGTVTFPNGNGGFTTINTGVPTPAGQTNIAPPFVNNNNNGRGGGRGGNGGNAGGGNPVGIAGLGGLAQLLGGTGALSSQAGDIRIIAEPGSNTLLVRATDADWALVQQVVGGIDLRPLQVLIEVTIAEVQRTHDLDIGVSGSVTHTPKGRVSDDSATAPFPGNANDFILALTGGHGTINYNVAISALQSRGNVKVLSLPVIIAQNNVQATLNVGSSRPFVQVSQTVPSDPTGRVQTVQYIDVGTVLTITPTINPDGYVNLVVSQTDNSATNEVQFDAPVIDKREATTQIFIRDGQTTVIGGLSGNSHSQTISGIPFLSKIPIIGQALFGSTIKNDEVTELFLFLTPHIINSDEDIDKLRDAVKSGSELLKDVNVGPRFTPRTDTLPIPSKPDTTKKTPTDSMALLRRRPPVDSSAWR
jgi:type II secretory pathway component GspD/PulD (secretin)